MIPPVFLTTCNTPLLSQCIVLRSSGVSPHACRSAPEVASEPGITNSRLSFHAWHPSSWHGSYYIVQWLIDAMEDRFWDQVGLPLLIGLAIQIVVAALCFLSVRICNCFVRLVNTETAVGDSAHDQPLPESDAAAHANGVPDVETGNGYGAAEGGQSTAEPELEMGIMNGGQGIEHFSDQEAHTQLIKSPVTTPKTQVTRDAATGALARPVEMDVPHSQQEEAAE